MTPRNTTLAVKKATDEKVRQHLRKILVSKAFRHVDRLQSFLSFIVEEMVAGRSDKLKEFVIGVEVFGKEASFDSAHGSAGTRPGEKTSHTIGTVLP